VWDLHRVVDGVHLGGKGGGFGVFFFFFFFFSLGKMAHVRLVYEIR
jgi:hypothetical protein